MRDIRGSVISKAFEFLSDDETLKIVKGANLTINEMSAIYNLMFRSTHYKTLRYICEQEFGNRFYFLGDFYIQCLDNNRFDLLPDPQFIFSHEASFKQTLRHILGHEPKSGTVKILGVLTSKFGVKFLNNLYLLFLMGDQEHFKINLQKVCNLNHDRQLPGDVYAWGKVFKLLLEHYSFERSFHLMLYANDQYGDDISYMTRNIHGVSKAEFKEILPKKPKTMKEVHDCLSKYLLKKATAPFDLNQKIISIDGIFVGEYKIQVPRTSTDLVDTSVKLKHCVHTYAQRVKNGSCQILNLKKDNKLVYTIELSYALGKWRIVQFKGFQNSTEMQDEAGADLRNQILTLLSEGHKVYDG